MVKFHPLEFDMTFSRFFFIQRETNYAASMLSF